jgi:hypothetical protein
MYLVIKLFTIQVLLVVNDLMFMLTLVDEETWVPLEYGGLNRSIKVGCTSFILFSNLNLKPSSLPHNFLFLTNCF